MNVKKFIQKCTKSDQTQKQRKTNYFKYNTYTVFI